MTQAGPAGQKTLSPKMSETIDIAVDLVEVAAAKTSNGTVAMIALVMAAIDVWRRCKTDGATWGDLRKILGDIVGLNENGGCGSLDEIRKMDDYALDLVMVGREGSA